MVKSKSEVWNVIVYEAKLNDELLEKLIAMEEALWKLEYTMTPGALPEKVTES